MKHEVGKASQHGQGMTEYIVIVALIAIAAIAVYQLFGQTVRSQTAGIALELSGQNAQPAIGSAQGAANRANTEGTTGRTLGTYQDNAGRGGGGGADGGGAGGGAN